MLGPGGEGVPGDGMADGLADLLDEDEEDAGPERRAMNFSRGPQIVEHEKEKKDVGEESGDVGLAEDRRKRPAGDGGNQESGGGDNDEAVMGGGIEACAKCEKDEDGKAEHVRDGNDVESLRIETGADVGSGERVGGGQNADEDHETGEKETGDAEAAVNVHTARGDERGLHDEQENPSGKDGAVDVNAQVGQRGMKKSGEILGVSEAEENGAKQQEGYCGEEKMVVAAARRS